MIKEGKVQFDEYVRGEGVLTLAFVAFTALFLGSLVVPLGLAQPQRSATSERTGGVVLSQDFATTGVKAADLLRDWQQHIAFTLQNGYPLSELAIAVDRDRAADALRLAELAASNDADRVALEQLRDLFESLQRWSDNLVEEKRNMRLARYYMSPTALDDDPVFQKNEKCVRLITSMMAGKHLVDTTGCE